MNDPSNGSRSGSRNPVAAQGGHEDERSGFGGRPTWREPARPSEMHAPAAGYDWEHPPRDEEDEEGLEGTTPRRRRGAGESSPYPRHQVAALGSKARVVRDRWGVPHIHAKQEHDAYAALGFCMAQDRLAQMDLIRRAATGRLAEVQGAAAVRHDALVRTAGIARRAAAAASQVRGIAREVLAAFVGGINAVCANPPGSGPGARPIAPWTLADCLAVELYAAWTISLAVWPAKLILARILGAAGLERARWVSPIKLDLEAANEERVALWRRIDPRTVELLRAGGGVGGSAFAVAAERTNGGAVLACDLHLSPCLPPPVYLAHLEAPEISVVGAALVGFPAIVAGRNARCAWGVAPLALDDTDCVTEELDGIGNFRTEQGWRKLATRREVIRVEGGDAVRIDVVETRNGPLLTRLVEQLEGERTDGVRPVSVAVRWGVNSLASSLAGWLALAKSDSLDRVGDAAGWLDRGPLALGLVAADADGTVREWTVGSLPTRGAEARLPVRGPTGEGRWRGATPLSARSHTGSAGPDGCVVSCGQMRSDGDVHAPATATSFRSRRIAELLGRGDVTLSGCEAILRDVVDLAMAEIVPCLRKALAAEGGAGDGPAVRLLADWNGGAQADSSACALAYVAVCERLLPELFPEGRFGALAQAESLPWAGLVRILTAESSPWFAGPAERDAAVARAIGWAEQRLVERFGPDPSGWSWGRLHRVAAKRPPGDPETGSTMPTEWPAPGSPFTIDAAGFLPGAGSFEVTRAPVFRMVVDLASRSARLVIAGGQSGRVESPWFADQLAMWRAGEALELSLGEVSEGDTIELVPG